MAELGILPDHPRVELIEGRILEVAAHNARRRKAIAFSNTVLVQLFAATHVVQVQLPLDLGLYSQPEPDFSLVPLEQARDAPLHPTRPDLVIEVSDSSLGFDRKKGRIYAAASIPEYWLVNLRKSVLEVHSDPDQDTYRSTRLYRPDEKVRPLFQPEVEVPLTSFFP